jgi:hypothetical protein
MFIPPLIIASRSIDNREAADRAVDAFLPENYRISAVF